MISHLILSNSGILFYLLDVFLLINVILFFIGFSSNGKAYKIFTLYLMIIFIGEIIAKVLIYNKYENICMSHYYFILQFILLSFFYLEILILSIQKKIIKFNLIFITILLLTQYLFKPDLLFVFNLFEVFVCSFSIIVYATFHFYNMLNGKRIFYYINSGILIYLFGSTIIFLSGNVIIMKNGGYSRFLIYFNALLYIFYLLTISLEWLKNYSKTK